MDAMYDNGPNPLTIWIHPPVNPQLGLGVAGVLFPSPSRSSRRPLSPASRSSSGASPSVVGIRLGRQAGLQCNRGVRIGLAGEPLRFGCGCCSSGEGVGSGEGLSPGFGRRGSGEGVGVDWPHGLGFGPWAWLESLLLLLLLSLLLLLLMLPLLLFSVSGRPPPTPLVPTAWTKPRSQASPPPTPLPPQTRA